MALLAKKYRSNLSAKDDYILDPVILMLAWKKAHHSIRSTNWYADVFELDSSAIELEENVKEWSKNLIDDSFCFHPLKLVPAPKTESWGFDEKDGFKWKPSARIKKEESTKELRPIAHVGIRDQTIMTALMMLLANQVETLQGDSSVDFTEVHEKGVVNYGNRLYCHYNNDDKASFLWGSQSVYNQYFKDYQQFLARPVYFGKKATSTAIESEKVYEVHLDLKKFYDKINRSLLIDKIKQIIVNEGDVRVIDRVLNAFIHWEWKDGSEDLYKKVCRTNDDNQQSIPKGIPQGLVAGGFFANIYLIDFDKKMSEAINSKLEGSSIFIVDYCRYVDDMRIVLKTNCNVRLDTIKTEIEDYVSESLGLNNASPLELNKKKTHVEEFTLKTLGISNTLKEIQTKISGPLSENSIDEQLGHLEGLIGLAESLRDKGVSRKNTNSLANIECPMLDVREDTLLRFAANKIHTLLKQKRSLVAQEVDDNEQLIAGDWDYLQERMARRFIAAWSKDPSLIVLLKKGLELFPDPKILTPVLEQLSDVLDRTDKEKERQIAIFCMGEIFRHAATVIHSKDRWAIPVQANVEVFFGMLLNKAINFIQESDKDTRLEALVIQAMFLCLVKNDTPFDVETDNVRFNTISKMMKGYRTIYPSKVHKIPNLFMNALLAYKLAHNKAEVVKSISHILNEKWDNPAYIRFNERLITEAQSVFYELFNYGKQHGQEWVHKSDIIKDLVKKYGITQQPYRGKLNEINGQYVSLLRIVKRPDNPFAHENAVLKLVSSILDKELNSFDSDFDFVNTKVKCSDWGDLQSFKPTLECDFKKDTSLVFGMPDWVKDEHKPFYRLGMFIRSCLLGSVDWTQNASISSGVSTYRGIMEWIHYLVPR